MSKITKATSGLLWVLLGILALVFFLYGFITEVQVDNLLLFVCLTVGLGFKIISVLYEWYHYVAIRPVTVQQPSKQWTVDMLTTSCPEEPREMIEQTLRAMVAVQYPHQTYLCDEGNDPWLRDLCQQLGVHHITRQTRENAKAGNINNGLKNATGELCVILDPDHVPAPDFFDGLLHHFDDPQIGYVQIVQAYKNQSESLVAQAAAQQTYLFYGPLMQGMNQYGTAQAIGANCTFRRQALDSIGGHAAGLTEDMHTSMLLHAKGWKSVYVPKIASYGLVPSSLSAYYKQQLKWARGTFDLWLHVLPKLLAQLTWKQRLHYSILPLYYLFGIVTFLDIAIPVYSLITGDYPWLMNPAVFFLYFTPYFLCSLSIRLFAQRWLYEPHEHGLHLLGGILRTGTWWVYIVGFVYTLLNIKVPYIPTPKEHNSKNEFRLGLPNLLLAIISLAAVVYGLNRDWQPYSFLMATFAACNAVVLLLAFLMGQTSWFDSLKNIYRRRLFKTITIKWGTQLKLTRAAIPLIVILPITVSLLFISSVDESATTSLVSQVNKTPKKSTGGFYTGIYMPAVDQEKSITSVKQAEQEAQHSFSIVSTYLSWGDSPLPDTLWKEIIQKDAIPMITWEPWTNLFTKYTNHPDISQNRKVFFYITKGYFDAYIDTMAITLRSLGHPVYLRFAHEMDNPMYPWSTTGGNSPEEFIAAWRYVHNRFEALGVQNVTWVWNPLKPSAIDTYFPDDKSYKDSWYVDWVGITCLNYGKANSNQAWYTFEQLYTPFQDKLKKAKLNLPVMLAEFGSTSYGGNATTWVIDGLQKIQSGYPEIRSVVLFHSDKDKNWITNWRPTEESAVINWTNNLSAFSNILKGLNAVKMPAFTRDTTQTISKNKNIKGNSGSFTWEVNGKPIYIKGVCYNPAHDWRDGFYPLTRKQLEHDFKRIKAMGANTIRRYEPGIYDRNILTVAAEQGLYVMYGFWFDPAIDYFKDSVAVANYEKEVIDYVKQYKDRKNIIAWNIGNESWGLLKKHFNKPYLTINRRAYLHFLERIADKIHEIDPDRPVFASEEHFELASTIYEMRMYAPSIDVIGINSYYEAKIESLQSVFSKFDTLRPYVVTEFGPKGYWDSDLSDMRNDSLLIEVSSVAKAKWYKHQWIEYIEKNKGNNLGGFAFSWRDRYEGTATWFGITDYKGRLKPAYYYLQGVWSGKTNHSNQHPDLTIVGSWYPAKAGDEVWVSAGISNGYPGRLQYEWEVYEEETWKRVSIIENKIYNDRFIKVIIPNKKHHYRVYVHATDSVGNVVTASRPLAIE
ncbi:glycosyltransferase family 2 protein [Rhodocytophaga aerolata]|uniref:Glycosyltransferase family 2 protein n=1 Tax=Rhodocytophaga aerolata TaxID=455078 RepID=A0ABT8RGI5_9BACT|nr:glycosyltransferase [Rhodocytophaga aerolata]MDO1451220.1 glycosyltransferase family 2 protein [Rhodocytophaga aerolata]